MAWSWSHTEEAYQNAYNNLENLSREDLEIIYAEICTSMKINVKARSEYITEDTNSFNETYYEYFLEKAKNKPSGDILVNGIWDYMSEELRTCDNGGFNAHCCPYGCHTVSFDENKEEEI